MEFEDQKAYTMRNFNIIGGRIVHILDQMCALENEMLERIRRQGLDFTQRILIVTRLIPDAKGTTCNQRLEKITGTEYTHILRVPFRSEKGILRKWIQGLTYGLIWRPLLRMLQVKLLLSYRDIQTLLLGITVMGILLHLCWLIKWELHSVLLRLRWRKKKYPDSNIYWKKFEEKYHFSTQFTADLIAMNNADFIITSTYQEIAGTQVSRCIRISYRSLSSREGCCTFGRFLSTLQGGS
ncbi:hypothetical protein ACFX15_030741 [Malus domestica]